MNVPSISSRAGQLYETTDRAEAPSAAFVNRTANRPYWPGEDPIGKQLTVSVQFGYEHDA